MRRVPVFVGPRIVEMADAVRVARLSEAKNAEVVRKRKTRIVVQINLLSMELVEGGEEDFNRGDLRYTYEENLGGHPVETLKRYDPKDQTFKEWPKDAHFSPLRWNPDRVEGSRPGMGL